MYDAFLGCAGSGAGKIGNTQGRCLQGICQAQTSPYSASAEVIYNATVVS